MSSHATIRAAVAELYRELPPAGKTVWCVVYSDASGIDRIAGPLDSLQSATAADRELRRDGYSHCRVRRLS